jgi:glycosyltransferase involved in cell wall biosynthesis
MTATTTSSRPYRVLLIVENVALARDHRLRKQAEALVSRGYQVSVICRRDPANHETGGIRIHDYRAPRDAESKLGFIREYGYSWAMAAWLTLKTFLSEGFDAIQISGTPDIYFTIGLPFKLLGRPVVLDQRDLSPELYEVRYGRHGFVYRVLRRLERTSYRVTDHVITVNGSLEEIVYSRGTLPPGRVTVVGNGPVLERTYRRHPQLELKHGRRFLCCWLGMMNPQDQVEVALHAIRHLVHELGRTDCQFTFIGDGEARRACEELAGELDIADWVSFPGWATEEEAFTYLSTADLGLEPNLEDIVSPVKGMEYMAFGLPFVAFDLKETRALAGRAAVYARPGDVSGFAALIDGLLDDPARRASMGQIGRQLVEENVAWNHQRTAYLQVYQRLLGDDRPGTDSPVSRERSMEGST